MFARWIKAQRVAFAAYRLTYPGAPIEVQQLLNWEFSALNPKTYRAFLSHLPPAVLRLLSNVPKTRYVSSTGALSTLKEDCDAALQRRSQPHPKKGIVRSNAASFIANFILFGTGDPRLLPRLATSVLDPAWASWSTDPIPDAVQCSVETLRSPWTPSTARLRAINTLSHAFAQAPGWEYTANTLYHYSFCWPLLVFANNTTQNILAAFSLPVAIDIVFDNRSRTDACPKTPTSLDISAWARSFHTAVEAAKTLFQTKHGNRDPYPQKVLAASVIFDFSVADAIVQGFPGPVSLHDRSMEVYFSQAVLSRLLGYSPCLPMVATGLISDPITGEHSDVIRKDIRIVGKRRERPDYKLHWPQHIRDKLRFVFETESFEGVLLPDRQYLESHQSERLRDIDDFIESSKSIQSANVVFQKTLSGVADCMQPPAWRRNIYVRCLDIQQALHTHKHSPYHIRHLAPFNSNRVRDCLQLLRDTQSPVISLPPEINALHVASALSLVNNHKRRKIPAYAKGSTQYQRPAPISWLFIRTTTEELDDLFWYVVWKHIGAPPDLFEKFQHSPTPEHAADHLANALNCSSPTHDAPSHHTPDLIVIIAAKRLSEGFDSLPNPLSRPHALDALIPELANLLNPHPHPLMRQLIGNSRIILLAEDVTCNAVTSPVQPLTSIERQALDRLATFRHSFTQHQASILLKELGYEGRQVRDLLKNLSQQRFLLSYFRGSYYIPKNTRDLLSTPNPSLLASCHFSAGFSFAPYLAPTDLPALSGDSAFLPHNVHEAQYHFLQALHYAKQTSSSNQLRQRTHAALHRLQRFASIPSWHVVDHLARAKSGLRDAHDLATQFLQTARNLGYPVHPSRLSLTARVAALRSRDLSLHPHPQTSARSQLFHQQAMNLFEDALKACDALPSERDFNRLSILSSYSLFLEDYASDHQERLRAHEILDEVSKLLSQNIDGTAVPGEWYERRGDEQDNLPAAAAIYRQGIDAAPKWANNWIKFFGTCANSTRQRAYLSKLSLEDAHHVLLNSLKRQTSLDPAIEQRWSRGLQVIKSHWPKSRRIQSFFYRQQRSFTPFSRDHA